MKSQYSTNNLIMFIAIALLLLNGFCGIAAGQSPAGDVAIKGYDTVAYFQAGEAIKGNESYAVQWHNLTWYFLTKDNRDLFETSPEKYAPQYDGYCAWAMTEARKAVTDPEVWKIVNGKLYLNCSIAAYEKWSSDIPGNIKKADTNWIKFNSSLENVQTFPSEGRYHLEPGEKWKYGRTPPTSGPHDPVPIKPGFYKTPQAPEKLVHSLEHGNIVIYYEKPTPLALRQLKGWVKQYNGKWDGIIVTQLPGLGNSVILTAWTKLLRLDSFDPVKASAFIGSFRGKGPEHGEDDM